MKTKAFLSLLFLSVIFFILQVFSVKAQNVGVGTENPTQKLEVSGNLKIGDNLFITGDSVYQTYENLASYSSEVSNSPGAFVIVTDLPLSTMWTVRVEGYLWESKPIIDLTISGYRHDWTTKTAFVNSSEQRVDVHVASTDSSTLVIVVGDTAANYDYPKLTVSTFRKGYQYPEDEYADNWYIVQKTSLAEFNGLHAVDDQTYIYKQWGEYGDDLFFTAGKVGINYNTPEYPFHLRTFDNTANYPLLESDHLQPGLVDSAFAIRGIVRTNEVDDPGAAIFGLHDQTSGASSGIRGESKSAAGFGVSGYASASSGTNYGVFGKTNSSDGYAGYFEGGENYFEGNVGVGTTSPDQKLEVAGNIKLGDNIMVEGSSTYKVYRNLATYYSGSTSSSGAFVIKTNQTTGPIWSMKITGHIWGASDLFELTVAGYTTSSNLCYVYDGSRDMRVRAGYDAAGKMVIILGEFTDTYSYPNLKVSEFRQSFSSMSEDYADGWTIEQETSMGAYTSVNDAANVTFELWEQNGDDIYYSNGNVGIGTSSPGQKLQVNVNTGLASSRAIFGYNESTGTNNFMHGVVGETKSNATSNPGCGVVGFASTTTGNGIGVKGEAYGPGSRGVYGWVTNTSGTNYGIFGRTSSPNGYAGYFEGGRNYFQGKVGIDNVSPTEKLHINNGNIKVENTSAYLILNGTNTTSGLASVTFQDNGTSKKSFYYENNNDKLLLYDHVSLDYNLGVDAAGFLGVGTIFPSTTLHVAHPSGISNGFTLQNTNDNDEWHYYVYTTNDLTLYFNGVEKGSWDDVSGTYTASSDARLKKNVSGLRPVLDDVLNLKPREYHFTVQEDGSRKYIGFIAQEVMDAFPALVYYQDESDLYMLDYSGFGVLAIKAIQEQQEIIGDLQQEVDELKQKVDYLMERIGEGE